MVLATKEVPKTPFLGQQYIRVPVGTEGTARKPSLYARIIETAHAYPISVPGHVEIGIANEFGLREVAICQMPLAAFVYASERRYAPERIVQQGLINRGYALSADGYEALVTREGKVVMTLKKSENGFNLMTVGDIESMIRDREDEETFDLIAGLFAA